MNFSTYKVNPEKQTIRLSKSTIFLYKRISRQKSQVKSTNVFFYFLCSNFFFSHIIINVRRETAECNSYTNKKRANFTIRSWHIDWDDKCEKCERNRKKELWNKVEKDWNDGSKKTLIT